MHILTATASAACSGPWPHGKRCSGLCRFLCFFSCPGLPQIPMAALKLYRLGHVTGHIKSWLSPDKNSIPLISPSVRKEYLTALISLSVGTVPLQMLEHLEKSRVSNILY